MSLFLDQDAKILDILLKNGANVNREDKSGDSPLYTAVIANENEPVVDLLIRYSGPLNRPIVKGDGLTLLHLCALKGFHKTAESLVKNGANVMAVDKHQNTPLHVVAAAGDSDNYFAIAELLLTNRADVNAKNVANETPLDDASDGRSNTIHLDSIM